MNEEPSYYAVIPADVRYDKRLTANAKLLYGEITALCNKHGFCWASNRYFADLYGKSKGTISEWVKQLKQAGYIDFQVYRNDKNEVENRMIWLLGLPEKTRVPSPEKSGYPYPEKPEHNITRSNTTRTNSERARFTPPTPEEAYAYAQEKNYTWFTKTEAERFCAYWESRGWSRKGEKMKSWKGSVTTWALNDKPEEKKEQGTPMPQAFKDEIERGHQKMYEMLGYTKGLKKEGL